jgi:hypothetical protein
MHELMFARLDDAEQGLGGVRGGPAPELTAEEQQRLLGWVQTVAAVPKDQVLAERRKARPLGHEVIYRHRERSGDHDLFVYSQRCDGQESARWSAKVGDPDQGIGWQWADVPIIDESQQLTAKPVNPLLADAMPQEAPKAAESTAVSIYTPAELESEFGAGQEWEKLR